MAMAEAVDGTRVQTFRSDGGTRSLFLQGMARKAENAV
jgi:hypothetical protein